MSTRGGSRSTSFEWGCGSSGGSGLDVDELIVGVDLFPVVETFLGVG